MRTSLPGWLAVVLSSGNSACVNGQSDMTNHTAQPMHSARDHADKNEGNPLDLDRLL